MLGKSQNKINPFETLNKLKVHDHLCLIYETKNEQFDTAIPFIKIGLEKGERCIYIADDNSVSAVLHEMSTQGIDVDKALKSKAMMVVTKKDSYLREGSFDPDRMIDFLTETTNHTKEEGYSALRVTGEMTWALGGDKGNERLIEFEAKLNLFFPNHDCLSICQYNNNHFSSDVILNVIRTHPNVIFKGIVCKNLYYIPPDEFLKPNQVSFEVERLLKNILDREKAEEKKTNKILINFGVKVRVERKKRNLSQEKLGEFAGLHRTYIGMIERAEKNITLNNIHKIANALDIDICSLFD